jgi:hypothetical protein
MRFKAHACAPAHAAVGSLTAPTHREPSSASLPVGAEATAGSAAKFVGDREWTRQEPDRAATWSSSAMGVLRRAVVLHLAPVDGDERRLAVAARPVEVALELESREVADPPGDHQQDLDRHRGPHQEDRHREGHRRSRVQTLRRSAPHPARRQRVVATGMACTTTRSW